MPWHMLNFSELQRQPLHVQILSFAGAYLDAAELQCASLCQNVKNANYAHGAVVMSLTFHSLELFFKAGILKLNPNEQFAGNSGHDLDALSKRFFNLYPKREFQFEVPFRNELPREIDGMRSDEIVTLRAYAAERKKAAPEDQRHRYPIDVHGRSWRGAFGFEPNTFMRTLKDLQAIFIRVRPLLETSDEHIGQLGSTP